MFVGSSSSHRRSMCSQFNVRACVYLSVRQAGGGHCSRRGGGGGGTQETANRSFPGKKARGDPQCSIGGNEPCGAWA